MKIGIGTCGTLLKRRKPFGRTKTIPSSEHSNSFAAGFYRGRDYSSSIARALRGRSGLPRAIFGAAADQRFSIAQNRKGTLV